MKRLVKKVELSFFQDDNGIHGLCHTNTQDSDNGFDAFWDGFLFFHDVFEHAHEKTNKYFMGDYAMNVGGEMTAMGAMWYYYNVLSVSNRLRGSNYYRPSERMKQTTLSEVKEALYSGYCRFGNTLLSNVPKQKPVNDSDLEYEIADFWKQVKETPVSDNLDEVEFATEYKESVTFRKIADLHRYGFRMAERLVPDNWDNCQTLNNFIDYWGEFCTRNRAEDLNGYFSEMTFYIYKENDRISWKAKLTSRHPSEIEDVIITEESSTMLCIEDYYIPFDEN